MHCALLYSHNQGLSHQVKKLSGNTTDEGALKERYHKSRSDPSAAHWSAVNGCDGVLINIATVTYVITSIIQCFIYPNNSEGNRTGNVICAQQPNGGFNQWAGNTKDNSSQL